MSVITFFGWLLLLISHLAVAVLTYLATRNSKSLRDKIDMAYARGKAEAAAAYEKAKKK